MLGDIQLKVMHHFHSLYIHRLFCTKYSTGSVAHPRGLGALIRVNPGQDAQLLKGTQAHTLTHFGKIGNKHHPILHGFGPE